MANCTTEENAEKQKQHKANILETSTEIFLKIKISCSTESILQSCSRNA